MTIGHRIKKKREELGLSIADVANQLDKDRTTIYRYETDYILEVPASILEPLSRVLKTTPAYLMGWEDEASDNHGDIEFNLGRPGNFLRERRLELGLELSDIAEATGEDLLTVSE